MTETQDFHSPKTRKLRLQPLHISALPMHPSFTATTIEKTSHPPLRAFVLEVLAEAVAFSDEIVPQQFQKRGEPKPSQPSVAWVQVLGSDLLQGESWFARRSVHVDEAGLGSASWGEFVGGLFEEHSLHEAEYTPGVFDARKVVGWEEEVKSVEVEEGWESYESVAMEIYEMAHQMPTPLQNRAFSTLVIRAMLPASENEQPSFVVAQIPVYISTHPEAFYSNGRHRSKGDTALKREKLTMGHYVSVERVKKLSEGKIWWEMATASDAGGWLPMGVQKMGVPTAVVKDVGFFIGWAEKKRRGQA